MLIIGSSGFAKEILEIFHQKDDLKDVRFFDDVNTNIEDKLYGQFPILKEESKVKEYFEKVSRYFVIGIGNPPLRHKMYKKFLKLGGLCNGVYSSKANIGNYDVNIGEGVIIMDGVNISNSVFIGKGTMIYYNSNITHDCIIGEFVEISPSVNILGRVKVGNFVRLGANCTILPDVVIGDNVVVGAGSVVTRDIEDNKIVAGIPAKEYPFS